MGFIYSRGIGLSGGGKVEGRRSFEENYLYDAGEVPEGVRKWFLRGVKVERVVQPGDVEELREEVRRAYEEGEAITPRGAGTFGLGGAIPVRGGVVVDLSPRMEVRLDRENGEIEAGAGVRWSQIFRLLEGSGFSLPMHITNVYSTVAGAVATGNMGAGSTRFGSLQNVVSSLEVVSPRGEVCTLASSHPDFPFYFGSEGQFGIIWKVRLRLIPAQPEIVAVLVSSPEAVSLFHFAQKVLQMPVYHMKYHNAHRMKEINLLWGREIFKPEPSLLIVVWNTEEAGQISRMAKGEGLEVYPRHLAFALWQERLFSLRVKQLGPGLVASEVVMPEDLALLFLERVERSAERWGISLSAEGHFLKGKEILLILSSAVARATVLSSLFSLALLRAGIRHGGRPYGIGIWNTPYARYKFGPRFVLWKEFKRRVDPERLFNPGKFFELPPGVLWQGYRFFGGMASDLVSRVGRWFPGGNHQVKTWTRNRLRDASEYCSRCGSCIPVCPAYLYTKDERTTARGKLMFYRSLRGRNSYSFEDVQPFLWCMHCHACTDVCQSELDLLPVWEELEGEIGRRWGKDEEKIREFIAGVEKSGVMEHHPYGRLLGK